MTPGGYDAFDDPYSYRGSNCLKNRLGLRDPDVLQAFELEMSSLRAAEGLPLGHFGAAHYRRVHWHLFRDVYTWAGRYRTVRTAKGGNWFCFPESIAAQMDSVFARLQTASFLPGFDGDVFFSKAASDQAAQVWSSERRSMITLESTRIIGVGLSPRPAGGRASGR